jgi:hypothetical protein
MLATPSMAAGHGAEPPGDRIVVLGLQAQLL